MSEVAEPALAIDYDGPLGRRIIELHVWAVRQGFIGDISWADTWPGLVTLAGLGAAFGAMAVRQLLRVGR